VITFCLHRLADRSLIHESLDSLKNAVEVEVVDSLASAVVVLAGTYLLGLGAVALVSPSKAKAFLGGFAGSAFAHYLELCIRLVVGAAFLRCAPRMLFPGLFLVFGWVLVVTTVALFAVPWRLHHRFAQWAVPLATRNLKLFAFNSFVGGIVVLVCVLSGLVTLPDLS